MDKVAYVSNIKYPNDTTQAEKAFEMMNQGLKVMFCETRTAQGMMVLKMFKRKDINYYTWEHYYPGDYEEWFSSGGCLEPEDLQLKIDQLSRWYGPLKISVQNRQS